MPLIDILKGTLMFLQRFSEQNNEDSPVIAPEDERNQERAMYILYHFEKELGSIALKHLQDTSLIPSSIKKDIKKKTKQEIDDQKIEELVEASYLSTLFDLAACAFDQESKLKGNGIRNIKEICTTNNVFDARNAVAHPNSRWLSDYWRSVDLLANHRFVAQLGLKRTVEAYEAAIRDSFEPPPEAWIRAVEQIEIPNNLSTAYATNEHTRFIGRKQERDNIKKMIMKGLARRISVVAPGGYGKTALVLYCFTDIAKGYQEKSEFNRIMFISAKAEILTYKGEQAVTPTLHNDIDLGKQISRVLLNNRKAKWEDARKALEDERLLLCIDNVETLNEAARSRLSSMMVGEFPDSWTVVATSRVDIENTTVIRLKKMSSTDFTALTYDFAKRHDVHLDEDQVKLLADKVTTPLAMRIVLDLHRMQLDIMSAIRSAEKLTANFAYHRLIDALDDSTRPILKVLYTVSEPISVPTISDLLHWTIDETQAAVVEAGARSLVEVVDETSVTLQTSVRQFFEDHDEALDEGIFRRWTELEARRERLLDVDELETELGRDFDDIDQSDLKNELLNIIKSIVYGTDKLKLDSKIQRLKETYSKSNAILRAQAMIAESAQEWGRKTHALEAAMALNSKDWRAGMMLAEEYRDRRRFNRAIEICTNLMADLDIPDNVRDRLTEIYYTARLWLATDRELENVRDSAKDEFERIIEETCNWKERNPPHIWATIHATALRRSVERNEIGSERRAKRLKSAFLVYRWLVDNENILPQKRARAELQNLARQFFLLYKEEIGGSIYVDNISDFVTFLGKYMDDLLISPNEKRRKWQALMRDFIEVDQGVLAKNISEDDRKRWNIRSNVWGRFGSENEFIRTEVYNHHRRKPYLLYTKDNREEYIVHCRNTHCSIDRFSKLEKGTNIWIKPGEKEEGKSAIRALWAIVQ